MTLRPLPLLAVLASLMFGLCSVPAGSAKAGTLLDLSFDESHWLIAPTTNAANGDPRPILARLDEDSLAWHSQIVIDTGSNYRTWLQSEVTWPDKPPACTCSDTCPGACAVKRNVLAFQLSPSSLDDPLHKKDKVQLQLEEMEDPKATYFPVGGKEVRRYVAFEFMLDPTYATPQGPRGPGNFTIHFQLTQGPGHPVYTIQTDQNADDPDAIDLVFFANNDEIETSFYCDPSETPRWERKSHFEVFRMPNIQRGEWNKVVLQFIPPYSSGCSRADGCGQLAGWVNGTPRPTFVFKGDWGYEPGQNTMSCRNTLVPDLMSPGMGMYRSINNGVQTIYFVNVKVGGSFRSVNT